jgi:hypothetical protein
VTLSTLFFSTKGFSSDWPLEKLPPILEAVPTEPFETLSKVGAGDKTIDAARLQTQREAIKVSADAIVNLKCENGRIRWEGLVFQKQKAYCEGYAIHFTQPKK